MTPAGCDETGREALAGLIQEGVARMNKTRRTLGFNLDDALSLAMLVYDNADKIAAALSAAPVARATMPRGGVETDWYAESIKLYRKNKTLRKALQEQHDWHLAQGEQEIEGVTLNMANEYGDSGMCERTTAALDAVLPSGIAGYEKWKEQKASPVAQEPVATLDERMKAAGMIPLSELLSTDMPISKWQSHTGVRDLKTFEEWLLRRYEEFLRMRVAYELGDKDKTDDLYEWVLAHVGALAEVRANFRSAVTSPPATPARVSAEDIARLRDKMVDDFRNASGDPMGDLDARDEAHLRGIKKAFNAILALTRAEGK